MRRPLWPQAPVEYHRRLTSTNDRAKVLAREGAPEGTLVVADEQTAGRGRQGRRWYSAPGLGLWCSLLVRPRLEPEQYPRLVAWAALAVFRTVRAFVRDGVGIKWPNDVLIGDRKVAGILLEGEGGGTRGFTAVVGIGINVNHGPEDFPAPVRDRAVSLRMALRTRGASGEGMGGAGVEALDRGSVLQRLLLELETTYAEERERAFAGVVEAIRPHSVTLGQRVRIADATGTHEGIAVDLTPEGMLQILDDEGQLRVVRSGEVQVAGGRRGS